MINILIVDDVIENINLIKDILKGEGYNLESTTDPTKVRALVEELGIDLVLLDVVMPVQNGFVTCASIPRYIPVIFVSALLDDVALEKAEALEAVDYITKPINPNWLKWRIKVAIKNIAQ